MSFHSLHLLLNLSMLIFHSILPTLASAYRQLHFYALPWHLTLSVPAQNTMPTSSSLQHHPAIFDHSHPFPFRPLLVFTLSNSLCILPNTYFLFPYKPFPIALENFSSHSLRNFHCLFHNSSQCSVTIICIHISSLQPFLISSTLFRAPSYELFHYTKHSPSFYARPPVSHHWHHWYVHSFTIYPNIFQSFSILSTSPPLDTSYFSCKLSW